MDASHVVRIKVAKRMRSETTISHVGMPKGIRASITTGEVRGINENHIANEELGSLIIDIITMIAKTIGTMMILLNC